MFLHLSAHARQELERSTKAQEALAAAKARTDDLQSQLTVATRRATSLEEEMDRSLQQAKQAMDANVALKVREPACGVATASVGILTHSCACACACAYACAQADVQALQTRVQEAEQRADAADANSSRLEELSERREKAFGDAVRGRAAEDAKVKNLEHKLGEARVEIDALTTQLAAARSIEEHLRQSIADAKRAATAACAAKAEAEANEARAVGSREELEDQLALARAEVETLTRDVKRQKELRSAAVMGGAKEQETIQACVCGLLCADTVRPLTPTCLPLWGCAAAAASFCLVCDCASGCNPRPTSCELSWRRSEPSSRQPSLIWRTPSNAWLQRATI